MAICEANASWKRYDVKMVLNCLETLLEITWYKNELLLVFINLVQSIIFLKKDAIYNLNERYLMRQACQVFLFYGSSIDILSKVRRLTMGLR